MSRTTYAALFAVIGTAFGAGDGSTTFNVPDMRGRVAAGVDNMGGTAAGRLTAGGSGITGTTLGASGGAETVAITSAQMPVHNHAVTDPGHSHTVLFGNTSSGGSLPYITSDAGSGSNSETVSGATGISIQNAGSGNAYNNMPPALVLNHVIKT